MNIAVKPLIWAKLSPTQWSGRAQDMYQCSVFRNISLSPISYHVTASNFPLHGPERFRTLKAAQAAAQAEWDAFIRAAIDT